MTRLLPPGIEAQDADPENCPLLLLDDRDLRAALHQWQDAMGAPWFGNCPLAGVKALEASIKGTRGWWADWKTDGPSTGRAYELPYHPNQYDRRADATSRYLHQLDVTRMYTTAAGVTECSLKALRHTGPMMFDRKLAGWWMVDSADLTWNWPDLPAPGGYRIDTHNPGHPVWLTTPTMTLLDQLATEGVQGTVRVLDSWTGASRPIFKTWNQGLEKLYRDGGPEMRATVKLAGKAAIGLLNKPGFSTLRPDWHFSVIAQARANLWRKIWRAYGQGITPLAVHVDSVWISSDEVDPERAVQGLWKFGDTPGTFKAKGFTDRKATS